MVVLLRIENQPTVRDQVASRLRSSIIDGSLKPGTRLVERELCEQLGVSRPSVREAIRQLENEGLITNVPNRGPIVVVLSEKTAAETFEVLSALEGLAARLFAHNASAEAMAEIKQRGDVLIATPKDAPASEYLAAKHRFFATLHRGADNEVLSHLSGMALRRSYQLRNLSVAKTGRAEESRKLIKKLVDALLARDGGAAEKACIEHIQNTSKAVCEALERDFKID